MAAAAHTPSAATSEATIVASSIAAPPTLHPYSCLSCRRKKKKCSRIYPCNNCTRLGSECVFAQRRVSTRQKPSAMDRLGFSYAAVSARRPAMVYCSISGFGNTGLMKDRPGYDVIVQGEAGIQDLTGPADGAPYKVGTSIADLVSGLNGSQAILAALYAV